MAIVCLIVGTNGTSSKSDPSSSILKSAAASGADSRAQPMSPPTWNGRSFGPGASGGTWSLTSMTGLPVIFAILRASAERPMSLNSRATGSSPGSWR